MISPEAKTSISHYICLIYEVSLDHELDRKRDANSHPKSIEIGAAGAQGLDFYDFSSFLEAPVFGCISAWQKDDPKSKTIRSSGAQISKPSILLSAPRNARCSGEVRTG